MGVSPSLREVRIEPPRDELVATATNARFFEKLPEPGLSGCKYWKIQYKVKQVKRNDEFSFKEA